jgi:hypothetical protein
VIGQGSGFGPSRHLPSCSDLVAIGWKADIAQTSLIVEIDPNVWSGVRSKKISTSWR